MKLSQTKQTIDAYADGLKAVDAHTVAAGLRAVTLLLDEFSREPMSTLVARGSRVDPRLTAKPCSGGAAVSVAQVARQLDYLAKVLASGGAKIESTQDLGKLAKLLGRFQTESDNLSAVLDKLRDAMKPEPIEQKISSFIERLNRDTGTPSFDRTFAELAASPLKREQVVSIAKSVYGGIKNSTSRKGALDYIRKPHDAHMSARRGIEATGGRSAA